MKKFILLFLATVTTFLSCDVLAISKYITHRSNSVHHSGGDSMPVRPSNVENLPKSHEIQKTRTDLAEPVNNKKRLSAEELQKVKKSYDESILKGQPDPYKKLVTEGGIVAGPRESNLIAMIKIKNSGKGDYYRRYANTQLSKDTVAQKQIKQDYLQAGDSLIVDPSGYL